MPKRKYAYDTLVTAPVPWSDRKAGARLIALGLLPFAAGRVLAIVDAKDDLPEICPFRLITGLPCPFCGSTRAFKAAASRDPAFLQYNPFWVVVAAFMFFAGVTTLFTRVSYKRVWAERGSPPSYVMATALALGWITAMINRKSITA